MASFHELETVEAAHAAQGKSYLEFLRATSLSVGLYGLPAGAEDLQIPHSEDEVYYILSGKARFRTGETEQQVGPGSILFVEAGAGHRFFDIEQDLRALVFFAPPESTGVDGLGQMAK